MLDAALVVRCEDLLHQVAGDAAFAPGPQDAKLSDGQFTTSTWKCTHSQSDRESLPIRVKMLQRLLQQKILHRLAIEWLGGQSQIAKGARVEFGREFLRKVHFR
jgi:hypothetical protein